MSSPLPAPLRALTAACALAFSAAACGGSSSETPPPLPPHALHKAYRVPRVVSPPHAEIDTAAEGEEVEAEEDEAGARPAAVPAGGRPSQTWGSDAPPRLPESELK